ncbi:MAG: hypothetical protein Q8Q52_04060 [Acidimicrobiia bacterium]|nr:hypothetical protein [Acidimicrobiia bacterium]
MAQPTTDRLPDLVKRLYDQEFRRWAARADSKGDFEGRVKGLRIAVFQ